MKVRTAELVKKLESIKLGLSKEATIEQSDCFVFNGKSIVTFNGEVCCRVKFESDFHGAVVAEPLLALLQKMKEEEIDIEFGDSAVTIEGRSSRTSINVQGEVALPIECIEKPDKWKDASEDLVKAISTVRTCAGHDENRFVLTCVHIAPKWVEACDDVRMCRYATKTGFSESVMIKADVLGGFGGLKISKFCITPDWLHFRVEGGVLISCKQVVGNYPDMGPFLQVSGEKVKLPKSGIEDAIEECSVFLKSEDEKVVHVSLDDNKILLEGRGLHGWHKKRKRAAYEGRPLKFAIYTDLLSDISRRSTECVVGDRSMMISTDTYQYVTCIAKPE